MPLVNLSINARSYEMHCGDGQEAHLRELAASLSARVTALARENNGVDEARLLVMAALLLVEDVGLEQQAHAQTQRRLDNAQAALGQIEDAPKATDNSDQRRVTASAVARATDYVADVIDDVSERLERVVLRLEA